MKKFLSFFGCQACSSSTVTPQADPFCFPPEAKDIASHDADANDPSGALSQVSTKVSTPKSSCAPTFIGEVENELLQLKALSSLERKKQEVRFIRKYLRSCKNMYLVESSWSESYTAYLKQQVGPTMPEIDNSSLLESGQLRGDAKFKIDYFEVPEEVWTMVVSLYGGGPEIKKPDVVMTAISAVGIQNKLYSCFINSGLQFLLSVPELVDYFQRAAYEDIPYETVRPNKLYSQQTTQLIRQVTESKGTFVRNKGLRQLFEKKFQRIAQHDCHEFLQYYLSIVQDQLNPKTDRRETSKKQTVNNGWKAYTEYMQYHPSIINTLFSGIIKKTVKCQSCENRSITYDPFQELVLDINADSSLSASLQQYFSEEPLDCPICCLKCRKSTQSTIKLEISHSPDYLMLILKRFTSCSKKIDSNLTYEMNLNLSKYHSKQTQSRFSLMAAIVHTGDINSGHYSCYAQRSRQWYFFNDSKVKKILPSDALHGGAYILLYRKEC